MKTYASKIAVKPTTITEDTYYQSWYNSDDKSMRLKRMHLQLDSADAGGNGNSIFAFARITGNPSGGTSITAVRFDTGNEPSKMICQRNQAGLTMTGVVIEDYFLERSIISKSTGSASTIEFDSEEGFLIAPNQGLVIFADNTIIAGAGCYGMLEWVEE